jgi:uncharacterized membrane-anchored protein
MRYFILCLCCFTSSFVFAKDPADSLELFQAELKKMDSIESTLHYKTGTFQLSGGIATITVPKGFKFLDAAEAKYVIEDLWGNLKGQSPLGMVFPESSSATMADYAFIIEYESIGYVKDGDADDINYDDLLKQMKEEQGKANQERIAAGLESMTLIGWASKPFYDKENKVLHWAKEFKVEGSAENGLNYDIRILGRKGVLILQAVSGIAALDSVKKNIQPILSMVSFNNGNKYADFDSKTDDVAAWTIGGLVAGKVLAKVGFFAVIMKFLKFILLGLAAIGAAIMKFFRGRKKQEEVIYEPAPVAEENVPGQN